MVAMVVAEHHLVVHLATVVHHRQDDLVLLALDVQSPAAMVDYGHPKSPKNEKEKL